MQFGSIDMMEAPAEQGEGWGAPIPDKSKKRLRRERRARERGVEYTPQGRRQSRVNVESKSAMSQTMEAITRDAKGKRPKAADRPSSSRPAPTRQAGPKLSGKARRAERKKGGKR